MDARGARDAFAARLANHGAHVETVASDAASSRFVVELPEGATTRDVFACAADAGAVIVELRPIAAAFAPG